MADAIVRIFEVDTPIRRDLTEFHTAEGATRPSNNLIVHARGADILVHEAYLPEHFDRVDSKEVAENLKRYHTSATEAGGVAAAAGVTLLVLTHLIPAGAEETFIARASKHFTGKIVVGRDLMRF